MKLSVIIATHARPDALARLLDSLAPQLADAAGDASREIVVAENGTPAPSILPATAPPLEHLHDPRPGKCRIQNVAIRHARGDIIVCLDDDLFAAPSYLAEVERFFVEHPEFAAMKGRILAAEDPAAKVGADAAVWLDLPIVDHGEKVIEVRGAAHGIRAFSRTSRRTAPSTPFTKLGASEPQNLFALSTASSIAP